MNDNLNMEKVMLYVGIDISKLSFDVAILNNGSYQNVQFDNNSEGFKALSKKVKLFKKEAVFCMEATGIYGLALAKYLFNKGEKVIVVNPIKTHAFVKMEMSRNKTDKADAQSIARYCKHLDDKGEITKSLFKPKGEAFEKLQFLITRLEQLDKIATQEKNRLDVSLDKEAVRSIKSVMAHIDKQIIKIKKVLKEIVKQDETLKQQVELLMSIQGIGEKTAWSILAYLGDISLFSNAKQVTSYAGINPKIEQSGTSINKSSLSKVGNKRLRKALYMPALTAAKHNPLMKDLYKRLQQKGKPNKVALCAVMRKLLVLAYGVLKSGKAFDPCYQR
jgi:transposase